MYTQLTNNKKQEGKRQKSATIYAHVFHLRLLSIFLFLGIGMAIMEIYIYFLTKNVVINQGTWEHFAFRSGLTLISLSGVYWLGFLAFRSLKKLYHTHKEISRYRYFFSVCTLSLTLYLSSELWGVVIPYLPYVQLALATAAGVSLVRLIVRLTLKPEGTQ